MKRFSVPSYMGVLVFLCLSAAPLSAQNTVFNGDFETKDYAPMWALTGNNAHTGMNNFETVLGQNSPCLRRMPGNPNDNGGFEQEVHLLGGLTYLFHADIATKEYG